MHAYLIRRLIVMVPVVLLVTIIAFSLILLLPGDPALAILGEELARDKQLYEVLREELGLNRPIPVQYLDWLTRALRGDFGKSIRNRQPILEAIAQRMPVTIELGVLSTLLALFISIPIGIISAVRPRSLIDNIGTIIAIGGVATPSFWFGIMLIYLLAVFVRLLPPSGYVDPFQDLGANLRLMIMPTITLGTHSTASLMRQMRSALIEALQQDYIVTARAKGLRERMVVMRHALKNALIPVLTVLGLQVGHMFGGSVITETIFSLPGAGRMLVDSIFFRDFPCVQAIVLVMAVAIVLTNLMVDVAYSYIDPRIRHR